MDTDSDTYGWSRGALITETENAPSLIVSSSNVRFAMSAPSSPFLLPLLQKIVVIPEGYGVARR
jgi:hypothetical protein